MFDVRDFKDRMIVKGSKHTFVVNDVTFTLTLNNILLMCTWQLSPSVNGKRLYSNSSTMHEMAEYITKIANIMTHEKNPPKNKMVTVTNIIDQLTKMSENTEPLTVAI